MEINECLVCPKCNGKHFEIKREATYLYSYKLETPNTENWSSEDEALSFLFDNREQIGSNERLECMECGAQFPCDLGNNGTKIHLTILQRAIRSEFEKNPHFLG